MQHEKKIIFRNSQNAGISGRNHSERHSLFQPVEEPIEDPEQWWKGPLKYIIALFLLLLLIMWYFPKEAVRLDPEPMFIPSVDEVIPEWIVLSNETIRINDKNDYLRALMPAEPAIKQTANKISSLACDGSRVCQAKAIYYFIRDNYDYISDPINFEYVEYPQDFLYSGGGDCESGAIALASLLQGIGLHTQLVMIPRHMFIRVYIDEIAQRYRQEDNYVYLDWTCEVCSFGEVPSRDIVSEKVIIG